jgi:hypothetical protein
MNLEMQMFIWESTTTTIEKPSSNYASQNPIQCIPNIFYNWDKDGLTPISNKILRE